MLQGHRQILESPFSLPNLLVWGKVNTMALKWKIALGLYCAGVLYISSLPPENLPEQVAIVSDKALHMIEYAIMGILAWGAFGISGGGFPWGLLTFCVCFGIGDECLQDWMEQARDPDVWDVAADATGAFIGLLLSMVFWKR